jgi:hypothetical protein
MVRILAGGKEHPGSTDYLSDPRRDLNSYHIAAIQFRTLMLHASPITPWLCTLLAKNSLLSPTYNYVHGVRPDALRRCL